MTVVVFLSMLISAWSIVLKPATGLAHCPRHLAYYANARASVKYAAVSRPFGPGHRRVKRLANPPFWPEGMTLGDKLYRLGLLAPQKLEAIGVLVDRALRDAWPAQQDPLGRGRAPESWREQNNARKT